VSDVYTEPDQVLTNAAELSQLKISSSDAARTLQTENERLESSAKELRQQLCEQKTSIKLAEDNEREANKLVQRREQEVGLLKDQLDEVIHQRNGLQRRIDEELQPISNNSNNKFSSSPRMSKNSEATSSSSASQSTNSNLTSLILVIMGRSSAYFPELQA
jgi:chromosome segregation ATPase